MSITSFLLDRIPAGIFDRDSYKVEGKGFLYRFIETLGATFDNEIKTKIEGSWLLKDSLNVDEQYINLISNHLGIFEDMAVTDHSRRHLLQQIFSIARIRGTVQSYKDLLYFLGFSNVVIVEGGLNPVIYDNSLLRDNGVRRDLNNSTQNQGYRIMLYGSFTMDFSTFARMENIRKYLEPINADFLYYRYNDLALGDLAIEVSIVDGDLYYNNDADPGLTLSLDSQGNLVISGPNQDRYYVDNGTLYFITNS